MLNGACRSCYSFTSRSNRLIFARIPRKPEKSLAMSSKYTAFRCPEDLLEKAKLRAKRDRRSLSNYLITLIDRDVAGMDTTVTPEEAEELKSVKETEE